MGQQGYLRDEELLLMEAREAGKAWTDISAMLPGRTVTALKRHYNTFLRPKVSSLVITCASLILPQLCALRWPLIAEPLFGEGVCAECVSRKDACHDMSAHPDRILT